MDRRIPLSTLRAFEAVGRLAHVRRAADELHLTHAAVSRQIRILEDRLETRLFTREKRRMQLTSAGQRFLNSVQQSLAILEEGAIHLDPESIAGELVIASTPTISTNWLPTVIDAYCQRYPEVELHCITIEPHQQLLPKHFDLALCLGKPQVQGRPVSMLYREYYVPVCAPALQRSGQPVVQPGDLLDYPLIHERYQHWEQWFSLHGIDSTRGVRNIFFDYGFQSIEAARRGLGVALADQLEIASDLHRGSLIRLFDKPLPVSAGIYLVADNDDQATIRARLFVDELTRYLKESGTHPEIMPT